MRAGGLCFDTVMTMLSQDAAAIESAREALVDLAGPFGFSVLAETSPRSVARVLADACPCREVTLLKDPSVRVADVRALAQEAHAEGELLVVDASIPTLYGCRPLDCGADVVLSACDDIEGMVALMPRAGAKKRRMLAERVLNARLAAEDALLDLGSARELIAQDGDMFRLHARRAQRRFDCARAFAEYISCLDAVPSVWYPGLASHPDHALASSVLAHGAGPLLEFELPRGIEFDVLSGTLFAAGVDTVETVFVPSAVSGRVAVLAGDDDPLALVDVFDRAFAGL